MVPPAGEDPPDGVKGGDEAGGIKADGEPSVKGSNGGELTEYDLGEGIAEPVEAYTGRRSSTL